MRDNLYLCQRLARVWSCYFSDLKIENSLRIGFGPRARLRLGSIRRRNFRRNGDFDSLILINGHFRDRSIPDYVVDATIAHELCHYAHGVSSPLPQLYRYPHRDGVIDREITKRQLKKLVYKENSWLQRNWLNYLDRLKLAHS